MNRKHSRWFILLLLAFIWGSSFILIKKSLIHLTPIQVGALRILFTALALFSVGLKNISKVTLTQWYFIALTAFLGTFFPAFMFAFAVQQIDSSIVSILNSLTPLNTLIIGASIFSFSFLRKQFVGVVIGLIGALILILKGAELNPDQNYWYALLIVFASIGYAFNVNILKKHLNDLSALTIVTGNFLIIFVPALVILWMTDFFEVSYIKQAESSLLYLVILSIFGTAMAKTLFNKLIQMTSPIFSSSVTYLIPIVAIFWGVIDGERLYFGQFLAGILILVGVYLTNKGKRP